MEPPINDLPGRRSSRLVILDPQDRLLLFRYHDEHSNPFWGTVGGELKPGEDYLAAARRELHEETGFSDAIGPVLRQRDEVYAVARSKPARWLERYFLVRCESTDAVERNGWTEEERATIRAWKWWQLSEMLAEDPTSFKPEWLIELLRSVVGSRATRE